MPRGDRTGPFGYGPRTGRAAGFCAGYGAPGYMAAGPGAGWQRGQGFGRRRCYSGFGWNQAYNLPQTPAPGYQKGNYQPDIDNEKLSLINEARALKEQLLMLEKRIKDLEGEEKNKDELKFKNEGND